MRYFSILALLFATACSSSGQNAPPPAYLATQAFPDSVRSLGLRTIKGERLTFGEVLDTNRGKKMVIDIWGSWCRDCIVGYPKFEELRKYAGEKDIVYIFLSTDKDVQKWKAAITKFNIRGEHYLMDGAWKNPLSNYVVLDWVPRYLVLDENGNVIVPKATEADDIALKNALTQKRLE